MHFNSIISEAHMSSEVFNLEVLVYHCLHTCTTLRQKCWLLEGRVSSFQSKNDLKVDVK